MSGYKPLMLIVVLFAALLAACQSQTAQPEGVEPPATTMPETTMPDADAITTAATAFLANELGVTAADITVVSAEQTEFSDGCLGLGGPAESCLQAITPGWIVMLSTGGQEYEVHTDETGAQVRVAGNEGDDSDAITASAVAVLADELGIAPTDITVVSAEQTEFSDSCLGLGGPAESCLQAITPGWIVMLSAGGQEYEVHTDETGVNVRVAGNEAGGASDAITASAAAVLADQLGVAPDTITVVSAEQTEFSDGCLGLGGPDESCLQAITPGWIVILSANGQEYEVHTDETGVNVRIANDMQ
jgi:hypothetical protein